MKTTVSSVLLALALMPLAAGEGKVVMRDVVTDQDLSKRHQEIMAEGKKKEVVVTPREEDPTVVNAPPDIFELCEVITSRGKSALIPKRAIIHLPERFKANVAEPDQVRLVDWPTFLQENRAWIRTFEVTRSMAAGLEPLPGEAMERFGKEGKLVVATQMRGPISVLPLKEPESGELDEETAPENTAANSPKQ
ncbi:MAG: hypothetical protein AAGI48_06315 [Verrucomicrobiota bacterium]